MDELVYSIINGYDEISIFKILSAINESLDGEFVESSCIIEVMTSEDGINDIIDMLSDKGVIDCSDEYKFIEYVQDNQISESERIIYWFSIVLAENNKQETTDGIFDLESFIVEIESLALETELDESIIEIDNNELKNNIFNMRTYIEQDEDITDEDNEWN